MNNDSRSGRTLQIAILGAGAGGLCAAVKLKEAGINDFVILEKASGLAGTWFHNTYPGCACDLPSAIYSFSFEINREWSRPYAPQSEILTYLENIAAKHELLGHCRFNSEVSGIKWNHERALWIVTIASGETLEAEVVVTALGIFSEPVIPAFKGMETFTGKTFHSAQWDWDYDLQGKTVGVIGSAASAVQFVPEIVKKAAQVHVFQRTANWILPKSDEPYTAQQREHFRTDLNAAVSQRQEIYEFLDKSMVFEPRSMLEEATTAVLAALDIVEDPKVRTKLTPKDAFGCKRPLFSNEYLPAFNQANLELVTEPISRITATGIVTADGQERHVDALIFATGFAATKFITVIDVEGRDGLKIDDAWQDEPKGHLGITTSGFPNLFIIFGPNTTNGSQLVMHEAQADYVVRQINRIKTENLAWIDVHKEAQDQFSDSVQEEIKRVGIWTAGCSSYYQNAMGRIVTHWPFSMTEYREWTEQPDDDLYDSALVPNRGRTETSPV